MTIHIDVISEAESSGINLLHGDIVTLENGISASKWSPPHERISCSTAFLAGLCAPIGLLMDFFIKRLKND